jgi:PAS domain-containing protein
VDIPDDPGLPHPTPEEVLESAITATEAWLSQAALSRAIPEAMPDALLETDEAGLIVSVNLQFELMFGYHRSEVVGRAVEMLLPESVRDRHIKHRRAYVVSPNVREMGDRPYWPGGARMGSSALCR